MQESVVYLHGGVVEKRYYDEDGKLVEIRKVYPRNTPVKRLGNYKSCAGASGGHNS